MDSFGKFLNVFQTFGVAVATPIFSSLYSGRMAVDCVLHPIAFLFGDDALAKEIFVVVVQPNLFSHGLLILFLGNGILL